VSASGGNDMKIERIGIAIDDDASLKQQLQQ
jgi:hypothetical protein